MVAIVVRQKMLRPISKGQWDEAVPGVVNDLQQEGLLVYMADEDAEAVDILFVFYEAIDHSQVVENAILQRLISAETATLKQIVLCACDVSKPRVTGSQVRDLLIAQVHSANQDKTYLREQSFESLREAVRREISRSLFRAGLTRPRGPAGSEDILPIESVTANSQPRYTLRDL